MQPLIPAQAEMAGWTNWLNGDAFCSIKFLGLDEKSGFRRPSAFLMALVFCVAEEAFAISFSRWEQCSEMSPYSGYPSG